MDIKNPRAVAETYFRAWKERDFTTLREILADDVGFQGRSRPWTTPTSA